MTDDRTRAWEADRPCVEITVRWGDAVLAVSHLDPPRPFRVGEATTERAVDFVVDADVLGAQSCELVVVGDDGSVTVVAPPGCRIARDGQTTGDDAGVALGRLELDEPVVVTVGALRFEIGLVCAGRPVAGHFHVSKRMLPFTAVGLLAHLGLFALVGAAWPRAQGPDEDGMPSAAQIATMSQYLASADEREMEQREGTVESETAADAKEGGSGTRARGEEGSAGPLRRTARRYGVAGPEGADGHVARQAALREAAEFGLVGLLDASGRTDSSGNDPLSARGGGLAGAGVAGGGSAGVGASSRVAPGSTTQPMANTAPPVVERRLDPNGRFATTYRPGAGHLAAFESAVARGILPPSEREIVSDVGARYVPALAVPAGRALVVQTDVERAELPPSGGPVHLRLALRGSDVAPGERPHLSVHLVLDVSGSMRGEPIARARDAARALVARLAPTDDFSLTTFSTDAQVVVPDGPVGSRRSAIARAIAEVQEGGGTNVGRGLELGYGQAHAAAIPVDAVRVVLLLSDGRANEGITATPRLAALALGAFQDGIQTSSFGLGSDYDGELMSRIATDGAGGYYYLRDPEQIAPALTTELEHRLDPVATAVEVRVRLEPDVALMRVYGSQRLGDEEAQRVRAAELAVDRQAARRDRIRENRQDDRAGGMRFFIPAFARGDAHAMLLQLAVPAAGAARSIAIVEVKYKDRLAHRNMVDEIPIRVGFAVSDAASARTADPSVARTVQGFAAGEALNEAATRLGRGDRGGAVSLLAEREGILRRAAQVLDEPGFLRDAERLGRLRGRVDGTSTADPLVLAMLLETAGRAHMR